MDRKCKFNIPVKSTLTDKHYNDQQLKRTPIAHIHKTKQHVKCASPLARQGNLCWQVDSSDAAATCQENPPIMFNKAIHQARIARANILLRTAERAFRSSAASEREESRASRQSAGNQLLNNTKRGVIVWLLHETHKEGKVHILGLAGGMTAAKIPYEALEGEQFLRCRDG